MKEQKKKRVIVILLLISCFTSGYLLFLTSKKPFIPLENLDRVDSLLLKGLSRFNIEEQQIEVVTVKVDSMLTRKIYHINVAPAFAKTQLHAVLHRIFYRYSIETPGVVTFPEKDITIHLLYSDTVIRTLKLKTDPDLVMNHKNGRLLITFDTGPDDELIRELTSLGEPIPIVLKIENPMEANELNKQLSDTYPRILFWLHNHQGEDLLKTDMASALDKLKQLRDVLPSAMVIQFSSGGQTKPLLAKTGLTFIDGGDALFLDEAGGRESFFNTLNRLKTNNAPPIVVKGTETTISWLKEKLPELKKTGVRLRPPSAIHF